MHYAARFSLLVTHCPHQSMPQARFQSLSLDFLPRERPHASRHRVWKQPGNTFRPKLCKAHLDLTVCLQLEWTQRRMCIKQCPEDWDSAQCTSPLPPIPKRIRVLWIKACCAAWSDGYARKYFSVLLHTKNLLVWVIPKWKIYKAAD